MKVLKNITEEEVKKICELAGEPYLSFMTNSHGKWTDLGLEIQIETTSTLNGHIYDSCIWIKKDGTISLWRNNGGWNGSFYEPINTVPIITYLREQGYGFAGDIVNEAAESLKFATEIIERLIASKPVKNLDEHIAYFKSLTNE